MALNQTDIVPCGLCQRSEQRYTCPKCLVPYCSLMCYRSEIHLECSEIFYKQYVLNGLEFQYKAAEHYRPNILENYLPSCASEEVDSDDEKLDSSDTEDLEKCLQDVDFEDMGELWNCLSKNERKEFKSLLRSEEMPHLLVTKFVPWWIESSIVDSLEVDHIAGMIPKVKDGIQPLSKLTKHQPESVAVNGILNVLCSYVCVWRLYLGDWTNDISTAIRILVLTSATLRDGTNFTSAEEALEHAQHIACGHSKILIETARSDVRVILKEKQFTLAALSDVHKILLQRFKVKTISKKQMFNALKKVEFYLSYVFEYGIHGLSEYHSNT